MFRWTTPTIRHEVWVVPEQATATTYGELETHVARALCYWLVDQLPTRSYGELLRSLLEMRDFYAVGPAIERQLPAVAKPIRRLARTTRPEVELTEE